MDHSQSSVGRYEGTVYSNVSDYLTAVSSGGIDTMGTIEERRITHCCQKLK